MEKNQHWHGFLIFIILDPKTYGLKNSDKIQSESS
jgi:hypothetical protein